MELARYLEEHYHEKLFRQALRPGSYCPAQGWPDTPPLYHPQPRRATVTTFFPDGHGGHYTFTQLHLDIPPPGRGRRMAISQPGVLGSDIDHPIDLTTQSDPGASRPPWSNDPSSSELEDDPEAEWEGDETVE
jgi:hypothetical protein